MSYSDTSLKAKKENFENFEERATRGAGRLDATSTEALPEPMERKRKPKLRKDEQMFAMLCSFDIKDGKFLVVRATKKLCRRLAI